MILVPLSDTHNRQGQFHVPDGDIIAHAGDCLGRGDFSELERFVKWYSACPHPYKILVPGNHDWAFADYPEKARELCEKNGIILLIDQEVTIMGYKFYGSPWQPEFCNWAFNLPRGEELRKVWEKIPEKVDVLITHGPPHKILDGVPQRYPAGHQVMEHVGCEELVKAVALKKPQIHMFGHIHEGYGSYQLENDGTLFLNVSVCDGRYRPVNTVVSIDLEKVCKKTKT